MKKKVNEPAKKKTSMQGSGKKALPSCKPTESRQNEKQVCNYTSCQEAKRELHKGGHTEACEQLGKLPARTAG